MKRILTFLLLFFLLTSQAWGTSSITLTYPLSIIETYLKGDSPTANFVNADSMFVGNYSQPFRPIMRFDFSQLPAGLTITGASLHLYITGTNIGSATVDVYQMTRHNWNGTTATWNTYDGTNNWTTAGGDYTVTNGASLACPASSSWGAWDVTAIVQDAYANNSGVLDILVKKDVETPGSYQYASFQGRTYGAGSGNAAYLTITFSYPTAGTTITGTDTADANALSDYATDNFGAAQQIEMSGAGAGIRRGLMNFDFSSVPAGSIIVNAEIYTFPINGDGSPPDMLHVYRLTQTAWVEGTGNNVPDSGATWNTYDAGNSLSWTTPGGDYTTSLGGYTYGIGQYNGPSLVFDVTSIAQYALNHTGGHGYFLVRMDNESTGGGFWYATKENTTTAYHPYMSVTYVAPIVTGNGFWFGQP